MLYINSYAPINDKNAQALMSLLTQQINSGEKEFYFLFASPGGLVKDGLKHRSSFSFATALGIHHPLSLSFVHPLGEDP